MRMALSAGGRWRRCGGGFGRGLSFLPLPGRRRRVRLWITWPRQVKAHLAHVPGTAILTFF
jgi:hypothetical protein